MDTLVVHTGGIGDLLLAFPAIAALGADGPVDLLGRPGRLALARLAGIARHVLDLDASGFSSLFTGIPSGRLREQVQPYGRVVVWMRDDDGQIANGLRACGPADVRCFPGIPPADWDRHASAYFLDCLGLEAAAEPFRIGLPAEPPVRDLLIHPGSGSKSKNWPRERYEAVTATLLERGLGVAWSLGPAEEGLVLPRGVARVAPPNLEALAGELVLSRCYLGNDSGVTHLAAAVGLPVVALFGPTNPAVWAPAAPAVTVLRGEPWPDTDTVRNAVLRALGQREPPR
jgi:heptosyltransferase III